MELRERSASYLQKRWDSNGPDATFLETLFNKKKVGPEVKANHIRKAYPDKFMGYKADTFRVHFNKMKTAHGIMIEDRRRILNDVDEMDDDTSELKDVKNEEEEPNSSAASFSLFNEAAIEFKNPCFIMSSYKDPDTQVKKLQIVITPFVGVSDVNFSLDPSGNKAIVTYDWPHLISSEKNLFQSQITIGSFTSYHPKVLAIAEALRSTKGNIEDIPKGTLTINFPFQVETSAASQTKTSFKDDKNNCVIYIELSAHQELYDVKCSQTKINLAK